MQNLFAEHTPWHTPWMTRVLPVIAGIAERHAERTIFTRFNPARHPDELPGLWRRYYQRWAELTLDRLDPMLLELVPPLARLAPPAVTIDKRVYSPFVERALWVELRRRRADTLVSTGAETDVCVLAAVMDAVDHGYRVVLVTDSLMTLYHRRFAEQIEAAESKEILAAWQ